MQAHELLHMVVLSQLLKPLHATLQRFGPHMIEFEHESAPTQFTMHSDAMPHCTPPLHEPMPLHRISHRMPAGH